MIDHGICLLDRNYILLFRLFSSMKLCLDAIALFH